MKKLLICFILFSYLFPKEIQAQKNNDAAVAGAAIGAAIGVMIAIEQMKEQAELEATQYIINISHHFISSIYQDSTALLLNFNYLLTQLLIIPQFYKSNYVVKQAKKIRKEQFVLLEMVDCYLIFKNCKQ